MTHTLHYGTGVFEGIRARNTEKGVSIFRLNDHVDRLFASADSYNLKIPYTKEVIFEAIKDVVRKTSLNRHTSDLVFLVKEKWASSKRCSCKGFNSSVVLGSLFR